MENEEVEISTTYQLSSLQLVEPIFDPNAPLRAYPRIEEVTPEEGESQESRSDEDNFEQARQTEADGEQQAWPNVDTSSLFNSIENIEEKDEGRLREEIDRDRLTIGEVDTVFPPDSPVVVTFPRAESLDNSLTAVDPLESTFAEPIEEISSLHEDIIGTAFEQPIGENVFDGLEAPTVTLDSILDENDLYQLSTSELHKLLSDYDVAFDRDADDFEQLVLKVSELLFAFRDTTMDDEPTALADRPQTSSPPINTKEDEGKEECKICMDNLVDCVLIECGHMIACRQCGDRLDTCPICRSPVARVVTIYR